VQTTILVYGHDPLLLVTRRLLLENAGFRVFTTVELADAIQLTITHHFAILILCQTLDVKEREHILATAQGSRPPIKALILMADSTPIRTVGMQDVVLDSLVGPQTLLAVIDRMLESKARPTFSQAS
jgi:DNA-binding response OmpR family regulator